MTEFDKVLSLIETPTVKEAVNFKHLLHTDLVLGQTRYMCRYGTLSDGHEKITDAQRYFQAIKEMYALSENIFLQKANAMEHQADLIDAQNLLEKESLTETEKLRVKAKLLRAQCSLESIRIMIEDQLRMLDEYNKIRLELHSVVKEKYPEGIEQAEEDNWMAVAHYRHLKEQTQGFARERMSNIPLRPLKKAELGFQMNRADMVAPLIVSDEETAKKLKAEIENQLKIQEKTS